MPPEMSAPPLLVPKVTQFRATPCSQGASTWRASARITPRSDTWPRPGSVPRNQHAQPEREQQQEGR
jgi:hypothetical protein